MQSKQFEELVLQSLEQEMGGTRIYETALSCAVNPDLKKEWENYLDETKSHVAALEDVCRALSINPARETPGRAVVRKIGRALEDAMKLSMSSGDREAAELTASECVVLAETKDHLDWELLGKCAKEIDGSAASRLNAAYLKIEEQEDRHLYHTRGFCRELWVKYLGMNPVLPPLEEQRKVTTAIDAAKAEQASDKQR